MDEEQEAIESIKNLFKDCFIKNSTLDDESVSNEELITLEELSPLEVYENLRDLLTNLMNFKQNVLKSNSDTSSLIKRAEQFENLLQKLEGEVRTHIRIEQQLKLHIETCQSKIDELERKSDKDRAIIGSQTQELELKNQELVKLKKEKPINEDKFKMRDDLNKAPPRKIPLLTGLEIIKSHNANDNFMSKLKYSHNRNEKYQTLRNLLDQKHKECDQLIQSYEISNEKILEMREQHQSKNPLGVIHSKFKSVSSRHPGTAKINRDRSVRKSMHEVLNLFKKHDSTPLIKKELKENLNSARKKKVKSNSHLRSSSDRITIMTKT